MRYLWPILAGFLAIGCNDDEGGQPDDTDAEEPSGQLYLDADLPADQGTTPTEDSGTVETPDAQPLPVCDPLVGIGPLTPARALTEGPSYAPRAVWTGNRWGVTWRSPSEDPGVDEIWFGRVDSSGQPEGAPVKIGLSRTGLHSLVWTGVRFVVAWHSARLHDEGYTGLRLQRLSPDGVFQDDPLDLPTTHDVGHLAFSWVPSGDTGLLVYSRGQGIAGSAGLYAQPLAHDAQPEGAPITLSEESVQSPSVIYGDGSWGVAWHERSAPNPHDVLFTVINEQGRPLITEPQHLENEGAQGQLALSYGGSTYALGWNRVDEFGRLSMIVQLYDPSAYPQGRVTVSGPEQLGALTALNWLSPALFMVSWQDSLGAQGSTVGFTRINTNAQLLAPLALSSDESQALTGAQTAGTTSRIGTFYTRDPLPQPAGFSEAARVEMLVLGPCPVQ